MSTHHSSHGTRTVERHCDVAVVGGSAAGLAAALQLGRQRRSVIVIDAGEPRNAPAAHMHSFLGREGQPPAALIAAGREEVRSYGGEILDGRVASVSRLDDGRFRLDLVGGHAVLARRVVAASGLVDDLPDIEGLAEQWGRGVIHCPFCHGYEARDQRIVAIATHPRLLHVAVLFRQLTDRLTVVLHDGVGADEDDEAVRSLRASGVEVVAGEVVRIASAAAGEVCAVELADGTSLPADAVAVGPRFRVRAEPFAALGLEPVPHASGLGDHLETDGMGETSVPGVYAAGNVADPSQQVLAAAADGSRVGGSISFSLAEEDVSNAARPSGTALDWDHRYGGDQMWSGKPNGSLVHEASRLTPGRALDVGAGEGGDAIWLAEQGWDVTATDISAHALDRVAAEAARRGLAVVCLQADANDLDPYEAGAFDLVSAQYASIPRTPDDRGVRNLMAPVAPGGTLVVVSHDLEPMRTPIHTTTSSRAYDPDAYVRVEDVLAAVAHDPAWEVVVFEKRPRPSGSATDHLHVEDVVLRARRLR